MSSQSPQTVCGLQVNGRASDEGHGEGRAHSEDIVLALVAHDAQRRCCALLD
jgi:hypothetical protein